MHNDVCEILLNEEEIKEICKRLGQQISKDYEGKKLLLVGILNGSVVFMTDLLREITIPCQIDFMAISSYQGTKSTGAVNFKKDINIDIKDYHVLVVEDILESGRSLDYIVNVLKLREPASIKLCTLLDKPSNRAVPIEADYVGAVIPDKFVIGYGLDYNELYRNLPYVGVLDPKVYS